MRLRARPAIRWARRDRCTAAFRRVRRYSWMRCGNDGVLRLLAQTAFRRSQCAESPITRGKAGDSHRRCGTGVGTYDVLRLTRCFNGCRERRDLRRSRSEFCCRLSHSAMSSIPSQEEALFAEALAQPPTERGAFLARACGANIDLLAHLVALVAAQSERHGEQNSSLRLHRRVETRGRRMADRGCARIRETRLAGRAIAFLPVSVRRPLASDLVFDVTPRPK
jgi:hypothetical protein